MQTIDPNDPEQQKIIYMHHRDRIQDCHCGWAELGKSHAQHVLRVLRDYLMSGANDTP